MNRTDFFKYDLFSNINIEDPFFDSLKNDYVEFETWFNKKRDEKAYVYEDECGIQAFLYLKIEDAEVTDISPILPAKTRVKIGTLKINPRGTRFGERFIKKAIDYAIVNNSDELYVTVFEKHKSLVSIFQVYGFEIFGEKYSPNGTELVLLKKLNYKNYLEPPEIIRNNYPLISKSERSHLLAIWPIFHSRMFPDSILNTEKPYNVIKDISYTNSIEKIYISRIREAVEFKPNDNIVIYRTKEAGKSAEYSAVATSICKVVEVKTRKDFTCVDEVIRYCNYYSIFSEAEIRKEYFGDKPMVIIRMLYNTALKKRIIRKSLIDICNIDRDQYWGIINLTERQFSKILELGEVNESITID